MATLSAEQREEVRQIIRDEGLVTQHQFQAFEARILQIIAEFRTEVTTKIEAQNTRFEQVNTKIEAQNTRIEQLQGYMDVRFEKLHTEIHKSARNQTLWLSGIVLAAVGIIVTIMRLISP